MITFIWLTVEPILPMIPGFNRRLYVKGMESKLKFAIDNASAEELEHGLKYIVISYLDSCGYFMADCDWELMQNNPAWKPYSSKPFGEMLLDFACQWNMEHEGKNYEYKLKDSKRAMYGLEPCIHTKCPFYSEEKDTHCSKFFMPEDCAEYSVK